MRRDGIGDVDLYSLYCKLFWEGGEDGKGVSAIFVLPLPAVHSPAG